MRTKLKTKDLVISALLIAIGILIPMIFTGPPFRIVVGPYSATLMAHVPVIIAMFISPWTAGSLLLELLLDFSLQLRWLLRLERLHISCSQLWAHIC